MYTGNTNPEAAPGKIGVAIDVTVKLLKARKSLKRLLGDRYENAINPWIAAIEGASKESGKSRLEIATDVARHVQLDGMEKMLLMAATVEAIEREKQG